MALASSAVDDPAAIVVWLDHWHALIARAEHGQRDILAIDRGAEPETAYVQRVVEAAHDGGWIIVLGPDDERLTFDRQYEALYARPDRFVEVEASAAVSITELVDRLRFLEGARAGVAST